MNVAFDRWIPVVTLDGKPTLASLAEVLSDGTSFADLSVRPHERVALLRLLTCVAHTALDGPEDYDAWCQVPETLPHASTVYLKKWRDAFELFHPERPWLQVAALSKRPGTTAGDDDWTPVSKLAFDLATGNNTTLFDHEGLSGEDRIIPLSQTVLSMLTYQCFSPGGLISQVYWSGNKTSKSSKDAPCAPTSMIHGMVRGHDLAETVQRNLPTWDGVRRSYADRSLGRPVWEKPPASIADAEAVENNTSTYVGRLVPMSRVICLHLDGRRMLLGDGLGYPTFVDGFPPEPTSTVLLRQRDKKQERALLSYSPGRGIWRELGSIVVKRASDTGVGGPLSLESLQEDEACDLVVAAVSRDKASIVDVVESVFHVPSQLRSAEGTRAYASEINIAESRSKRLGWSVETYRKELDGGWEGRLKTAGPDKSKLLAKLRSGADMHFWTTVERNLGLLLAHVSAIGSEQAQPTREAWRRMLFATACEAYRTVCGQETPREIRAFALGWKKLVSDLDPSKKQHETIEPEEVEE